MATSSGDAVGKEQRRVPMAVALAAMVVALALAALILSRVAGPLYGLLFPSEVPVPGGSQEIEHVKPDKGAEYWIYRTRLTGREVAAFYESEGGACQYSARQVQPDESDPRVEGVSYSVATCRGSRQTAGIGISWEVFIAEGYSEDEGPTVFRVYRYSEVN